VEQGQPISILAVDDEPGVLALVRRCLGDDERVTLIEASSGKEALELIAHGLALDLLITDLRMPEMEGDELARQVRALEPDLKVLYLTSHADRLFDAKRQLWAEEAYLDKPFTREGLREAVALLLFGRTTL
jgi:CheY-like chemotaxis protein